MDTLKRNRLIEQLSQEPEPQFVPIEDFFDGNDDLGSIGCNLRNHPGIAAFREAFARLAQRTEVIAIYAQIAELDPGEGCWPFADTVYVVGALPNREVARAVAPLKPDEVYRAEQEELPAALVGRHQEPVCVIWWD